MASMKTDVVWSLYPKNLKEVFVTTLNLSLSYTNTKEEL